MEIVIGFIALVVLVCVVLGLGDTPAPPPAKRTPARPPVRHVAPRAMAPAAPAGFTAAQLERERQRIGDEAFFDGVVFGHYFLDGGDDRNAGDRDWSFEDGLDDGFLD